MAERAKTRLPEDASEKDHLPRFSIARTGQDTCILLATWPGRTGYGNLKPARLCRSRVRRQFNRTKIEGPAGIPQRSAQEAQEAEESSRALPTSPADRLHLVDTADQTRAPHRGPQSAPRDAGLDLETTGLRWWQDRIRIVSITTEAENTYVVDAFKVDITPLFPALRGTKIVAHNALFDLLFLKRAGFEPGECACTMILSQILWAGKLRPGTDKNVEHDLASVVKRALNISLDKSHQKEDWAGELTPEMLAYAARDSMFLLPLHKELTHRIAEARGLEWVVDIEMRLLKAMVHISDNGLPIDGGEVG